MPSQSLKGHFENAQTIAIIGCSSNPYRTSYHIAEYLQNSGYRIIPVNPNEEKVLGEKSYPAMSDIPEQIQIDMVDIFRNKKYTTEMVQMIVDWSRDSGQKPLIWTQLDVSTAKAEELAQKNGFFYVKNQCMMVKHRELVS